MCDFIIISLSLVIISMVKKKKKVVSKLMCLEISKIKYVKSFTDATGNISLICLSRANKIRGNEKYKTFELEIEII